MPELSDYECMVCESEYKFPTGGVKESLDCHAICRRVA